MTVPRLTTVLFGLASAAAFLPCEAVTPMPSAGNAHSLALHADGSVRAWGYDGRGQLGSGSVLFNRAPAAIPGLPPIRADAASIAPGNQHALAIDRDGAVWAWGMNSGGQLGDGTTTDRATPVRVSHLADTVAVAAGFSHSLAITADGAVWTWGHNGSGELGKPGPSREGRTRPAKIVLASAVAVSAGRSHSLVLTGDGTVWAFGSNQAGQIGDGTSTLRFTPVRVAGLTGVVAISAGAFHNVALKSDGTVWAWGRNDQGQLGDGTNVDRRTPVQVSGVANAVKIAAGWEFETSSIAVHADGTVSRWGARTGSTAAPVQGYAQVVQLDAGNNFSVAVRADGSVWTEGNDNNGTLGRDGSGAMPPGPVPGLTGVAAVAAGAFFALAVGSDGRVHAWGQNARGELGSGRALNRTTPARVLALQTATQVSAGGGNLALLADGTVATWGYLGETTSTPRIVAGISGVIQVAAGESHSVALRSDGTVWTWGFNDKGQLGRSTPHFIDATPGMVPGQSNVLRVAAGFHHTAVVRADGTVWVWGRNDAGQLGVPITASCRGSGVETWPCTPSPAQVPGIAGVNDVSASARHALALRGDGTVWTWGDNNEGALGRPAPGIDPVPAPVAGLGDVMQVAAGGEARLHSLALKRDGTVWTWGDNSRGQLGDGTLDFRSLPRQLEGLRDITRVSAGDLQAFALRSDGVLFGWGGNPVGQLGDGTVADRFKPVVVVREDGAGRFEAGDWFLDLDPAVGAPVAVDKAFMLVAEGSVGETDASVSAQIRYREADVGSSGGVYVFALAPASAVLGATAMKSSSLPGVYAKSQGKDTPVACVLAQMSESGQLVAVSAATVQAFVSGVFSAQGQAVTILNGVPVASIGGATFFVGYGSSSTTMINGGTNRSVASIPGALECKPQVPQTGWWWDPPPSAGAMSPRDGTGYSIEAQGNLLFFGAFLYDAGGRSSWYVSSGRTSLDGSLFVGELLQPSGGQTLGGAYRPFTNLANAGPITLAFNSATSGTMVWPGGTVPLGRFDIVPGGVSAAPRAGTPESGWWWNPEESGRGFFIEWQDGTADLAGYMYDDAGNPVWYLAVVPTPDPMRLSGNWLSFGNGMTLTGSWRPHQLVNGNVAPVSITFTSATTATMTLPNGRTTSLVRHRF